MILTFNNVCAYDFRYTPEEKLNLPLTTVMTSRPTPPEILYAEWKKKTDPTTATKNDEPKHKTGYLGTHYSTTPHLSHLATTPSSSHLTSTTTPLTSSASRSLRVKDRTSFKVTIFLFQKLHSSQLF